MTPPFNIEIIPVTPLQQNCSLIRTESGSMAVVDPGGDVERILAKAHAMNGTIEKIWLTHGHLDHAGGAMELKRRTGAIIEGAHREEAFWFDRIVEAGRHYRFETLGEDVVPDRWLEDGDTVDIDGHSFEVIFTPGHTPGHVVFYSPEVKLAFVGDVLFCGSIGRTDFPRGDRQTLVQSITTKLWPLGDDTQFIPGHGPMGTFGDERRSNPFVGDAVLNRG